MKGLPRSVEGESSSGEEELNIQRRSVEPQPIFITPLQRYRESETRIFEYPTLNTEHSIIK